MRGAFRSDERGWALVTALILMRIMMGVGLTTYSYVDQQGNQSPQRALARDRLQPRRGRAERPDLRAVARVGGEGPRREPVRGVHAGVGEQPLPECRQPLRPVPGPRHDGGRDVAHRGARQRHGDDTELLLRRVHREPAGLRQERRRQAVGPRGGAGEGPHPHAGRARHAPRSSRGHPARRGHRRAAWTTRTPATRSSSTDRRRASVAVRCRPPMPIPAWLPRPAQGGSQRNQVDDQVDRDHAASRATPGRRP